MYILKNNITLLFCVEYGNTNSLPSLEIVFPFRKYYYNSRTETSIEKKNTSRKYISKIYACKRKKNMKATKTKTTKETTNKRQKNTIFIFLPFFARKIFGINMLCLLP